MDVGPCSITPLAERTRESASSLCHQAASAEAGAPGPVPLAPGPVPPALQSLPAREESSPRADPEIEEAAILRALSCREL